MKQEPNIENINIEKKEFKKRDEVRHFLTGLAPELIEQYILEDKQYAEWRAENDNMPHIFDLWTLVDHFKDCGELIDWILSDSNDYYKFKITGVLNDKKITLEFIPNPDDMYQKLYRVSIEVL